MVRRRCFRVAAHTIKRMTANGASAISSGIKSSYFVTSSVLPSAYQIVAPARTTPSADHESADSSHARSPYSRGIASSHPAPTAPAATMIIASTGGHGGPRKPTTPIPAPTAAMTDVPNAQPQGPGSFGSSPS